MRLQFLAMLSIQVNLQLDIESIFHNLCTYNFTITTSILYSRPNNQNA